MVFSLPQTTMRRRMSYVAPPSGPVLVEDAGSSGANGIYTERGVFTDRPYYILEGEADDPSSNSITWDSERWVISGSGANLLYTSFDDVAFPWLATTWIELGGDLPVPTVIISP